MRCEVVGTGVCCLIALAFNPAAHAEDSVTVVILGSRMSNEQMAAGASASGWNLWLPDDEWHSISDLQSVTIAPAVDCQQTMKSRWSALADWCEWSAQGPTRTLSVTLTDVP